MPTVALEHFVGREPELARLARFADLAVGGNGQTVFVAGEAGNGKTALVEAFAAARCEGDEELVVALGNCNTQGGIGDPYLPFREVLAGLLGLGDGTGDAPAGSGTNQQQGRLRRFFDRSVEVLFDLGPDLIGTIVPGAALIARAGQAVADRTGWFDDLLHNDSRTLSDLGTAAVEQNRVFEQYANVLRALAVEQPLLLIIDDLHWADDASVGLLFHLSRRLADSRVLIVSTYRPDEMALWSSSGRGSLEKLLAEVKRYAGDVTIDLGQTDDDARRQFTNRYLDSEPNLLDEAFREQLFQRTGGHPLFTVELLRSLQERGHLEHDRDGRWVAARVDWETLPARVEGVIEERIARLDLAEREILEVASVEGTTFTAEVIAHVLETPMRQLLKGLAQRLDRQHRLVHERGDIKVGTTTLAGYQFTHALFQKYLYDELSNAERRLLHGSVARALIELHGERSDRLSPQLAWHFDRASEPTLAVEQYLRAGERAVAQGAPLDSRRFLERALELLVDDDPATRWRILAARLEAVRLLGEHDVRRSNIDAMLEIAGRTGDEGQLAVARSAEAALCSDAGDPRSTLDALALAIGHAERARNHALHAECLGLKAHALIRLGEVAAGRRAIERAFEVIELTDSVAARIVVLTRSWVYYFEIGELARSLQLAQRTVDTARSEPRHLIAVPLSNLGLNFIALGQYDRARQALEESLEHGAASGYRRGRGYGLQNLGLVTLYLGDGERAEQLLHDSRGEFADTGDVYGDAGTSLYLGLVLERSGRVTEAEEHYTVARDAFVSTGSQGLAAESTAGLARCALALGQLDLAARRAEEVWDYLETRGGLGTDHPIRLFLSVADVFQMLDDRARVEQVLDAGRAELLQRAARIDDEEARTSFVDNIPEHRLLLVRRPS